MSKSEFPTIPGYKIHKPLGRGGMAAVFLATQESIEREVAIKVMLPELGADPNFGDRFIREAKIVAKLTHPNIVAIFDVGTSGSYHYMSMELLPGGELKDKIGDAGLTAPDALRITRQVAAALDYAHSHGYVHRDVKPENVLFRKDGTCVLSDFGIARAHDVAATRMTATGAVVGTPYYMSPEQAQGKELDGRSDLYSLGIMFFEMLTGTVPYKGESALSIGIKHLKDPIPRLPGPYSKYQGLLDKMVAKNPEDRWQTGRDIANAIETLERGGSVEVDPNLASTAIYEAPPDMAKTMASTRIQTQVPGMGTPPPVSASRGPGMAIGLVVAALAIAGGGYWFWQKSGRPTEPVQTVAPGATVDTAAIEKQEKVAALLKRAAAAEKDKKFYGSDSANATALYKEVLAIDRGNSTAAAGLLAISQQFVVQAEKAIEQGKFEDAENLLKTAETVSPENPVIFTRRLALKDAQERTQREKARQAAAEQSRQRQAELQKQREAEASRRRASEPKVATVSAAQQEAANRKAREDQLNGLLSKARDYLNPSGLTPTRIALAYDLYREAMRVAPNDGRGSQGLQRVADAYLNVATARADAKQFDEASGLVQKGLEISPNHGQLLALQRNINEQKNAKKPQRTFGGF